MEGLDGHEKLFTVNKFKPVLVRPAAETYNGVYFLSNLDQNMAYLVELVFCFKGDERKNSDNVVEVIQKALAKVLLHFYPLAGSLMMSSDGKLMVDCTGEGVPFVEADADHEIKVLGDVSMLDLWKLRMLVHTFDQEAKNVLELPLLTVQVTRFKCGGFVLGIGMNHCIIDIVSLMEFMNSWAEIARGLPCTILPSLDRSILMRSRQPPKIKYPHHEFEKNKEVPFTLGQEKMVYRSFCVNPEKLRQLKRIAMEDGVINNCTYFTVLSAFLWRARTRVLKMEPNQQMKLLIAIDVRSKFNPPLSKGCFLNAITFACCICSAGELMSKPLSFAVQLVQEAIELVTEEYVRSAIDYYEVTRSRTSLINTFMISTWTKLPLHDVNFGWGDPTQVGPATSDEKGALLVRNGKEINNTIVSLCLPVSAMEIFQELMQFKIRLKSSI